MSHGFLRTGKILLLFLVFFLTGIPDAVCLVEWEELEKAVQRSLFEPAATPVGSESCGWCHAAEYNSWLDTPHARQSVAGCESCHGPGSHHRRVPLPQNIQRHPGLTLCQSCHTPDKEPDFPKQYPDLKEQVHPPQNIQTFNRLETALNQVVQTAQPVDLRLFVMLDCPYGLEAVNAFIPLALEMPEAFHIRLVFMADERILQATEPWECRSSGTLLESGSSWNSADREFLFEESLRMALIRELFPDNFLYYVQIRLSGSPNNDWLAVAASVGIAGELIEQEINNGLGWELLKSDAHQATQLGVHASPTLFFDGWEYPGAVSPITFARAWCEQSNRHEEYCKSLPECQTDFDCDMGNEYCKDAGSPEARCVKRSLIPVTLTVLDSVFCRTCYSDLIYSSARQLLPNLHIQWLDVLSEAGRSLAIRHDIERLPAFLFDPSLQAATDVYQDLQPILRPSPDGYWIEPELLEAPFLWQRKRQEKHLELWFDVGTPGTRLAEIWWSQNWARIPQDMHLSIHYLIREVNTSPDFTLMPSEDAGTLVLSPRLSERQADLYRRYALWQTAPQLMAHYTQSPGHLPDGLDRDAFAEKLHTVAPLHYHRDVENQAAMGFIQSEGVLIHNQIWIAGWEAGTIARIFHELGLELNDE